MADAKKKELDAQETTEESAADDIETEANEKEQTVPISELRKLRNEAAQWRKEAQALRAKMEADGKKAELAKMEETDRLKKIAADAEAQAATLKQRVELTSKRSAIISAASSLDFTDPNDALGQIDMAAIQYSDDGEVDIEAVSNMVKELSNRKPYLLKGEKKEEKGKFGPTNPPGKPYPQPKLTTAQQLDALKQQARDLTREGKVAAATKMFNRAWEIEHGVKKDTGG